MKKLFLDDERMPADVTWVDIGPGPWFIVRSFEQAVQWVKTYGFPDVISFDHDLGYEAFDTNAFGVVVVTNATEEKSGYDFAKWLVEYDMSYNLMPKDFKFTVHSMNPIGAENIRNYINEYRKHKG